MSRDVLFKQLSKKIQENMEEEIVEFSELITGLYPNVDKETLLTLLLSFLVGITMNEKIILKRIDKDFDFQNLFGDINYGDGEYKRT